MRRVSRNRFVKIYAWEKYQQAGLNRPALPFAFNLPTGSLTTNEVGNGTVEITLDTTTDLSPLFGEEAYKLQVVVSTSTTSWYFASMAVEITLKYKESIYLSLYFYTLAVKNAGGFI